jgi:hypothetical protein
LGRHVTSSMTDGMPPDLAPFRRQRAGRDPGRRPAASLTEDDRKGLFAGLYPDDRPPAGTGSSLMALYAPSAHRDGVHFAGLTRQPSCGFENTGTAKGRSACGREKETVTRTCRLTREPPAGGAPGTSGAGPFVSRCQYGRALCRTKPEHNDGMMRCRELPGQGGVHPFPPAARSYCGA